MADVESKSSENILYDLSVLCEWKYENELFVRSNREKVNTSLIGRVSSLVRRSTWTFLRSAGVPMQMPTPCLLPEQLVKLKSSQNNWKIAVSNSGTYVAVAQENGIEIRSHRDNLETPCGRNAFPLDPYPQWRCIVWSDDETMVACSRSCGAVDVFDIVGSLLFTIPGVQEDGLGSLDLSDAVAALIFTDYKPVDKLWTSELLVINYHGCMSSYLVDRDNGFKLRYTFVFASEYPRGISSVSFDVKHKILFVGGTGLVDASLSSSKARQEGISAWRLLSDAPYCKLVTDYEEDKLKAKMKVSFLSKLKVPYSWNNLQVDGIFHLCLSPATSLLVAIHFSGKLSEWEVPSLRLRNEFDLESQPGWDELNPELLENPTKKKRIKDLVPHKQLIDVNFWSEDLLILARCTGAVSVVSSSDLHNLLGTSLEWFEPSPQLTQAHNGGFLGLECEIHFPKKRILMPSVDNLDEDEDDSDEEDPSLMARSTRVSKQVLYYLTDSERFQPPKKKPRLVTKVYRIVSLKSTTPEELFTKKIEAEEYGEALSLAQAYMLDSDLVYQKQWRKSAVTRASIEDYLSKISKRSWVLHECMERVPENIDAMRELLEYGLHGTDLPALVAVGKGEDGGRFILCDPDEDLYDEVYDPFDPDSQQLKEEKRAEIRKSYLDEINFQNLNLEQKEMCRARLKFLTYLDRLKTYELILGGTLAAVERYNAEFYTHFRARNIFELTTEYAQKNDWAAVEILFIYHSDELAPHRLAILSNFPETSDPNEYKSLLPKLSEDEEVIPWETDSWRHPDWSEAFECRKAVDLGCDDEASFLYTDFNNKYRIENLTSNLIQEWYHERACDIERRSKIVDNAIELVKLGIEKGVDSLSELLDDLVIMEMLVYECGVDIAFEFSQLREMADYDRLELIMAKSPEEMYIKNLRRWMVPFLQRCEKKESGSYDRLLRDFILTKACDDLTLVVKIFETSKPSVQLPVIRSHTELMSLALDAIYSCNRTDQLDLVTKIFECLPSKSNSKESPEMLRLHKQVDQLEQHLNAARILESNGLKQTFAYIKASENNPDEAKSLMIKLTRMASKRAIPLSDIDWYKLHDDVMLLQSQVYTNSITRSLCHEIFVESLMCSGKQDTIHLAGHMLERSSGDIKPIRPYKETLKDKVPYQRAVELVLSAAREYFNSSANLSDPCMDMARTCLNLILDSPKQIQEELDLIASLALLDEFGVSVLPLQVRLSKDRLELVRQAVVTKPTSYKQTQRLIRLGQLLGIATTDVQELEGQIIQMSAEASINAMDYDLAYQCCERLISLCHSPAWAVCVKLAEQEAFRNIVAKAKLLSFAMTYCSKDKIQQVLQARCLLETQILYERVNKVVIEVSETASNSSDIRESPFSAKAAIKQTQQILSSTKHTTSALLSTMTDAKWWQSAVSSLKQYTQVKAPDTRDCTFDNRNVDMKKQGCHPFYASLVKDCYEDSRALDYSGSYKDEDNSLSANILRTSILEETLTGRKTSEATSEALIELAKQSLPRDATLGLAYLMATPKDYDISICFEEFPSTDISLQLAVYYYALQVYNTLQPVTPPHVYALYRQPPSKIVGRAIQYISSVAESEWPQEVISLLKKLKNYQELLEDYNQACTLKRLGKGVDVIRFADDEVYKRETIFGLTMSLDDEVYNIALSLAQRYGLNLWDVYMCHIEFLFSDSGLSIEDIQARVNKLDLLTTLITRKSDFTDSMMKRIYPILSGTDLKGLQYFFSLMDCVEDKILCGLNPVEHVALLKKLKPACPTIDYKQLMDEKTPPMNVLGPCLTASNVTTVAKLSTQIPDKKKSFLNSSCVYSNWAVQVFWTGDATKKLPENMAGWIHRYESIHELIQKLRPEDFLELIDQIVFTATSRKTLDVACRDEITKRALKFSRQNLASKKKKQDDLGDVSWEDCSNHLQMRLSHLKSLTNDTIQSFAQATDPVFSTYAEKYDLSKGDIHQVELLLVQMILDGQAVELVDDILQVAPPSSLRTRTIVQQAVNLIVASLRNENIKEEISVSKPWLEVLQLVVENVREHHDNGGDLVQAEDVISLLRSFCSDNTIEVPHRLNVLKVLEKSFDLSECDKILLTLYRTQALVSIAWPNTQVNENKINTEESRMQFFSHLLDNSKSKEDYVTLSRLLILWPPVSDTYSLSLESNPWLKVFQSVLLTQDQEAGEIINTIIKQECSHFPLDYKCTEHLIELLCKQNLPIASVKLALRSSHEKLIKQSINLLSNQTQGLEDVDLLQLILCNKLAPQVVSMPVFSHLITYVLQCQGQPESPEYLNPSTIAAQLAEAGFQAEAGSLLLQAKSSHSIVLTFNSALVSVSHWLKKL
ncbi:neuroblastoma-amplified sequence [Biomphalaria glabrata]|nr:neuroblastoma-amplified sequence-like [Biomphalaria glabrata]